MDQVESRELRYFVAVAEELHFGRAAQRLHIAQPALSKTIQRLETHLGITLLERTSRSVALTDAGRALLEHGRHALSAMAFATRQAQQAGAREHLRLVIKPGGDAHLLSDVLAAYAERPGARPVDIFFGGPTDRTDYLHDGRADLALLYAPFDDLTGLAYRTLQVEGRVAVLPASHPLASRPAVHLSDLEGETFSRWTGVDATSGTGPEIADSAQLFPLVAIGRAIAVLPASLVTPSPPEVVCVPVQDAEPSSIVIARSARDNRSAVADFIEAAATSEVRSGNFDRRKGMCEVTDLS